MKWFVDLKIKTKLLVGFGLVIVLSLGLAAFALVALNTTVNTYQDNLNYSQKRVQTVQNIRYITMDIRRITTAIRADSNLSDRDTAVTRLQGHTTTTAQATKDISDELDLYIDLAKNDPALTQEQIDGLVKDAENKKTIAAQYKRDLIDPNIAFGLEGRLEEQAANTSAQASLISDFNSATDDMVAFEKELAGELIEIADAEAAYFRLILAIAASITTLMSLFLALYISGLINKPLTALAAFMHKVGSTGNLTITPEEERTLNYYMTLKDEVGQVVRYCGEFFEHVELVATELEAVAGGDLTIDVQIVSETDTLGNSLKHMVESLNHMFNEITSSTAQVSTGSKQIADGAQMLAQGSTEQSSTVQELSASMHEIAEKTKSNAETAGQAAALATTIMHNAEKGSRQMEEMTSAVKEINQASQSISKVIKVIDDIAFQTNILALNAAVEAARAGQHGKGFAVVAEEVRNLAGKSAEAAKDTGGLIANSMQKAELGGRIAGETAASLTEIVAGITDSTRLISDIAKSSEEQSEGIDMINQSIDQVAQVVHQNSAAVQESAAASQEMSGQALVLEQLIKQFKLKDEGIAQLPPAGKF